MNAYSETLYLINYYTNEIVAGTPYSSIDFSIYYGNENYQKKTSHCRLSEITSRMLNSTMILTPFLNDRHLMELGYMSALEQQDPQWRLSTLKSDCSSETLVPDFALLGSPI